VHIDAMMVPVEVACPIVNLTQQKIDLIVFCQSPEWNEWRDNGTIPVGKNESEYGNVYVLCENIFQPRTEMLDKILKLALLTALVFLMTGLGVTMEPSKIWQHAKRPVGAVVATIVQFGVMPFIAWGIGTFMAMDEITLITLVVLGCCPGGTMSNFMALLLRGDMNLSILMTSVSTVVGIGAIPFMIKFITGFFLDPCSMIEDATKDIILALMATLAPCALGMLIRAKCSQKVCDIILKLGQIVMFGTLILLYTINILIFKMSIILYFPPSMLVACALLPACGFLLGFGCSYAVCEVPRARRTIMLETGLKNAQICLAILKVSFPIARIGVLQMMPLYFLLFQIIESAILTCIFTKVLSIKDDDDQEEMLKYSEGADKSQFQRQVSYHIAERTNKRTGQTDQSLIVSERYKHSLSE